MLKRKRAAVNDESLAALLADAGVEAYLATSTPDAEEPENDAEDDDGDEGDED